MSKWICTGCNIIGESCIVDIGDGWEDRPTQCIYKPALRKQPEHISKWRRYKSEMPQDDEGEDKE